MLQKAAGNLRHTFFKRLFLAFISSEIQKKTKHEGHKIETLQYMYLPRHQNTPNCHFIRMIHQFSIKKQITKQKQVG